MRYKAEGDVLANQRPLICLRAIGFVCLDTVALSGCDIVLCENLSEKN